MEALFVRRRMRLAALVAALLVALAPATADAKRHHRKHHRSRPAPALSAPNPPAAIAGCADADLQPNAGDLDRVRAATLCLVNQERAKAGLGALAEQPQLEQAAGDHVGDMLARNFFGHVSPDGRSPLDRVTADGYLHGARSYVVGENLAYATGDATPARVVAAWMASAEHRDNILEPAFRDSGIAVAPAVPTTVADGLAAGLYAQEFGVRTP